MSARVLLCGCSTDGRICHEHKPRGVAPAPCVCTPIRCDMECPACGGPSAKTPCKAGDSIPVQAAHCACIPDDWRPCRGEFYECTGCGETSEEPFPYAEPMDSPGLDMTEASAWFYYCQKCAFEWILDGADVRRCA